MDDRAKQLDQLRHALGQFADLAVGGMAEPGLLGERDRGATILFSTHVMAHAERLCDRLAIIAGGGESASRPRHAPHRRAAGWVSPGRDRAGDSAPGRSAGGADPG
jgi:hypothetical protein